LLAFVMRVARANVAILITGESGTGKELIARAIHHYSMRSARPWIDLNCAALPELLIESELFGYERGAFSGALATKPGMFELAQTGSVFLDEIGELPPRMQVKLLRVLDGAPYYRLGGTRKISVDARVIAATNQDLEQAMAAGNFRRDLYYRLAQVHVHVPPLRERLDDIRPLARFFLEKQEPSLQLSDPALDALERYDWPGNVRELRNAIERGMILEESALITSSSLPTAISRLDGHVPLGIQATREIHREWTALEDSERSLVARALEQTRGNQTQAARLLRVTRDTLRYKKKKLNL
jgi:transcriptional regulator with PAS, ATPase and Fis domain